MFLQTTHTVCLNFMFLLPIETFFFFHCGGGGTCQTAEVQLANNITLNAALVLSFIFLLPYNYRDVTVKEMLITFALTQLNYY